MSTTSPSSDAEDSAQPQTPLKLEPIQLHLPKDVVVLPMCATMLGLCLGFLRGSRQSSLRFLAENAHRPPKTVQGWYFYTKTKNYRVLLGGMKEGGKDALKLGAVGVGWVGIAEGWQRLGYETNQRWFDEVGDVVAGAGTAALVSGIYRLPRRMALRTMGLGVGVGVTVSGLRQMQGWIRDDEDEN